MLVAAVNVGWGRFPFAIVWHMHDWLFQQQWYPPFAKCAKILVVSGCKCRIVAARVFNKFGSHDFCATAIRPQNLRPQTSDSPLVPGGCSIIKSLFSVGKADPIVGNPIIPQLEFLSSH
jgi:hypothetical protein